MPQRLDLSTHPLSGTTTPCPGCHGQKFTARRKGVCDAMAAFFAGALNLHTFIHVQ